MHTWRYPIQTSTQQKCSTWRNLNQRLFDLIMWLIDGGFVPSKLNYFGSNVGFPHLKSNFNFDSNSNFDQNSAIFHIYGEIFAKSSQIIAKSSEI